MSVAKATTNGHVNRLPKSPNVESLIAQAAAKGPVQIERIRMETIRVPIIGTAPLLMAKFSDKSKR